VARTPEFVPGRSGTVVGRSFQRRLAFLPLVAVVFFSVSGGPYGLEEAVGASGALITLALLLVVPFVWSLPAILMVAELSSAMPVEGGYYAWVKKGLGPFAGFLEGWWSWLNSFIDMAIYPVLFTDYLTTLLRRELGLTVFEDQPWLAWPLRLLLIWACVWLNLRGVRRVGLSSMLFVVLVLAPFGVMVAIGLPRLFEDATPLWQAARPEDTTLAGALGLGLFVVLWNYLGWDGPSTVLGEVSRPARAFPLALWAGFVLIVLAYVLPVLAGLSATTDPADWTSGSFPDIAAAVGGHWLGTLVAVGGLVSAAGLFNALLLSNSRLPFVLAEDGYLPAALTGQDPRTETPARAVVLSGAIYSVFAVAPFAFLVVVDVVVYSAALLLQFWALIVLRRTLPAMRRPSRVPGGWPGVLLISLSPVLVLAVAVAGTLLEEGVAALALAAAVLVTGPLVYPFLRRFVKRDQPDVAVPVELDPGRRG
jgi:amino acid transporter